MARKRTDLDRLQPGWCDATGPLQGGVGRQMSTARWASWHDHHTGGVPAEERFGLFLDGPTAGILDRLVFSGIGVSSAGDVNGDGLDDVLVGSPNVGGDEGRAYLIYGAPSGTASLSEADIILVGLRGSPARCEKLSKRFHR